MTIQTAISRIAYIGDNVSTTFNIPFLFFANSDLTVTKTAVGGGETTLTFAVDYNLSGAGSTVGGVLTKTTALLTGESMAIFLDPDITQLAHYAQNQSFPSATVELGFDKLTQIALRLQDQISRSVRAPDADSNVSAFLLPSATSRANSYLTFDSNGAPAIATTLPSGTLSQSTIGGYLYPQTAAEATASVTPTFYWYPPLNVRRYGAALNGTWTAGVVGGTDDSTAFNNAITVANVAGGGEVTYDGNARVLNLVHKDKVSFRGIGNSWLYVSPAVTADEGILSQGSLGTTIALSGAGTTYGIGGTYVATPATALLYQIQTASVTGLAVGQYVLVGDLTYVFGAAGTATSLYNGLGSTNGQNLETNRIVAISGAGPYLITLQNPMIGTYTAGGTPAAFITVLNAISNFSFTNVKIALATGANGGGIFGQFWVDFVVDKCNVYYPAAWPGIRLARCARGKVISNDIQQGQGSVAGGGSGLALDIIESSHNIDVSGNTFQWYNQNEIAMRVRHVKFINNTCLHAVDSAINTHGDTNSDILIAGNTIDGSENTGIAIGYSTDRTFDLNITVQGNTITNCGGQPITVVSQSGQNHKNVVVESNVIRAFKLTKVGTTQGIFANFVTDLTVKSNTIDGTTIGNVPDVLIGINNVTRAKVSQNYGANGTNTYGIQVATCSDYEVDNNHVYAVSSNNVYTLTSAGGEMRVHDNHSDDNTNNIEAAVKQWGNSWNVVIPQDGVKGTAAFAAATTAVVTTGVTLPNSTFQVALSQSATSPLPPWVTAKSTTQFTINFSANFTGNVDWVVFQ